MDLDQFLEEVNEKYQEAVLNKQISPKARQQVAHSKLGNRRVSSKKLAELEKLKKLAELEKLKMQSTPGTKPFHLLSLDSKLKLLAKAAAKTTKKVVKGPQYQTFINGALHPDVFYSLARRGNYPKGQTFIYTPSNKKYYHLQPNYIHHDVTVEEGIPFDMKQNVHGRWLNLKKDVEVDDPRSLLISLRGDDDTFSDGEGGVVIPKGIHVGFWKSQMSPEVKEAISKMPVQPDYVHLLTPEVFGVTYDAPPSDEMDEPDEDFDDLDWDDEDGSLDDEERRMYDAMDDLSLGTS
jgi:hypothetical protein